MSQRSWLKGTYAEWPERWAPAERARIDLAIDARAEDVPPSLLFGAWSRRADLKPVARRALEAALGDAEQGPTLSAYFLVAAAWNEALVEELIWLRARLSERGLDPIPHLRGLGRVIVRGGAPGFRQGVAALLALASDPDVLQDEVLAGMVTEVRRASGRRGRPYRYSLLRFNRFTRIK